MKKLSKEAVERIEQARREHRKRMRKEKRQYANTLQEKEELEDNVRSLVLKVVNNQFIILRAQILESFNSTLADMKEQGRFFRCQYKHISNKEMSVAKLKVLGSQGWKFAFEFNGNYVFQRERNYKKESSDE